MIFHKQITCFKCFPNKCFPKGKPNFQGHILRACSSPFSSASPSQSLVNHCSTNSFSPHTSRGTNHGHPQGAGDKAKLLNHIAPSIFQCQKLWGSLTGIQFTHGEASWEGGGRQHQAAKPPSCLGTEGSPQTEPSSVGLQLLLVTFIAHKLTSQRPADGNVHLPCWGKAQAALGQGALMQAGFLGSQDMLADHRMVWKSSSHTANSISHKIGRAHV